MQQSTVHTVGFVPMHPLTYLAARIVNAITDVRNDWNVYRANYGKEA